LTRNKLFTPSENKIFLTQEWDLPIIKDFCARIGSSLDYFGLSGEHLSDLECWKDYICSATSVQWVKYGSRKANIDSYQDSITSIINNSFQKDIPNFQLLRGDIQNVIFHGEDDFHIVPNKSAIDGGQIEFKYSLINLDFCGGLGHLKGPQGKKKILRVEAIKKLFERQKGTDFLLVLTLNVRDGIPDKILEYLSNTEERKTNKDIDSFIKWYLDRKEGEKDFLLKASVPLLIKSAGEYNNFSIYCHPIVSYDGGGGAKMVHFLFSCHYDSAGLRGFSKQQTNDLLKIPLIRFNGNFVVPAYHSEIEVDNFKDSLKFLSPINLEKIVNCIDLR
jgi:hypothetical protein